jgi:hypothetical protein
LPASLAILDRTVMVPTHPLHSGREIENIVHNIGVAARVALAGAPLDEAEFKAATALDPQKFDLKVDA